MQGSGAPERNPMVGSLHKYSDGYGYGMRYPTERNRMTVPASIPKHRHPPPPDHFVAGTKSTQLVHSDDRSMARNAQQIVFQTSGEIGRHSFGIPTESMRLKMQPLQRSGLSTVVPSSGSVEVATSRQLAASPLPESRAPASPLPSSRLPTGRGTARRDESQGSPYPLGMSASGNLFRETLGSLDKTFDRRAKSDLLAASLAPPSPQERMWSATTNYKESLNSKAWVLKLRQDT